MKQGIIFTIIGAVLISKSFIVGIIFLMLGVTKLLSHQTNPRHRTYNQMSADARRAGTTVPVTPELRSMLVQIYQKGLEQSPYLKK